MDYEELLRHIKIARGMGIFVDRKSAVIEFRGGFGLAIHDADGSRPYLSSTSRYLEGRFGAVYLKTLLRDCTRAHPDAILGQKKDIVGRSWPTITSAKNPGFRVRLNG